MTQDYHIVYVEQPGDEEWSTIGGGINAFNTQQAGDDHGKRLCFLLKSADDAILGGVIGVTYWDWLYVDLLWLKEEMRGQGYGHRLLTRAEDEARQRGAKNAYLDTFSFQSPDFYERHGYEVFGTLDNFPTGHQRYFMTKAL